MTIIFNLQEYLRSNRPDYVCRAEKRQNILSDLANLREERRNLKKNILLLNSCENNIPPNPLSNFVIIFFFYSD